MNPSEKIDAYLDTLGGWQKENLIMFRKLMHDAASEIEEEWKWDVPIFMLNGKMISAMSHFKEHTKFNFFNGASLQDPHKLFNSGLDSKKHRSINLAEGQKIDKDKLGDLIKEAIN